MMGIDAADGGDDLAIKRLEPRIEIGLVAVGRDRLVQKVVAEHGGLVAITRGDRFPQRDRERAIARHIEGQRKTGAVVVIDAGLPARRRVQIDDHAQAGVAAPAHQPIEQRPALPFECVGAAFHRRARLDEQPPVQRHPHGVEAGRLDETDVGLRDIDLAERAQKRAASSGADQALRSLPRFPRARACGELEHVAFGHQPVAEIDPLDGEALALRIDKLRAVGMDEIRRGMARRCCDDEREEKRNNAITEKPQAHTLTKIKALPAASFRRVFVPVAPGKY